MSDSNWEPKIQEMIESLKDHEQRILELEKCVCEIPPPPPPLLTVEILGEEKTSKGDWNAVGGAIGYALLPAAPVLPDGFALTVKDASNYVWAANTDDVRAMMKIPEGRVASCNYSNTGFSLDLTLPVGSHLVAFYFLDWDRRGRITDVDFIVDDAVVASHKMEGFGEGTYLLTRISTTNVTVKLTNKGGVNAVLSGVLFGAPTEAPPPPPPPPPPTGNLWNAEFVSQTIPPQLEAEKTFGASVTFKNTGDATWEWSSGKPGHPRLISLTGPQWGTEYMIVGQGRIIPPGSTCAISSTLRVPTVPGEYLFKWRLRDPQGNFFGQESEEIKITVVPSTVPPLEKEPLPPVLGGRRALTPEDIEYVGSFRLPNSVNGGGGGYSEIGVSMSDPTHLILNYTHPKLSLFEVEIPSELKPFTGTDWVKTTPAVVTKQWGAIRQDEVGMNGGFHFDPTTKKLYWSSSHGYWTGGDRQVLGVTVLNDDGTWTPVRTWKVPQQKWHWGGVTKLPKSFADLYTGGRTLGMGFGGYYSITAPCSRGPAISAFDEPNEAEVYLTGRQKLMGYTDPQAVIRTGDYLNANCGFWGTQPESLERGFWSFMDHCHSGAVIHLPDVQGCLMFADLGLGRLGYDYGSGTKAGGAIEWYFYDTKQMGEVATGERLSTLTPYLRYRDPQPMSYVNSKISGAYLDEATRLLYVVKVHAYRSGTEHHPLVNVYRIKQA